MRRAARRRLRSPSRLARTTRPAPPRPLAHRRGGAFVPRCPRSGGSAVPPESVQALRRHLRAPIPPALPPGGKIRPAATARPPESPSLDRPISRHRPSRRTGGDTRPRGETSGAAGRPCRPKAPPLLTSARLPVSSPHHARPPPSTQRPPPPLLPAHPSHRPATPEAQHPGIPLATRSTGPLLAQRPAVPPPGSIVGGDGRGPRGPFSGPQGREPTISAPQADPRGGPRRPRAQPGRAGAAV